MVALAYTPAMADHVMNMRLEAACQEHPRFVPMEEQGPVYVNVEEACRIPGMCGRIEENMTMYVVFSEMTMDRHCVRPKAWRPDSSIAYLITDLRHTYDDLQELRGLLPEVPVSEPEPIQVAEAE